MENSFDIALLIARLLLAAVFAVAGVAKIADRSGFRKAIIDFGLPSALAGARGLLLPLAELALAAALIPASTALWGAVGALGLLILFIVEEPSTWLADASQTATALGSCTPPQPDGRLWPATGY